MRSMHLRLAYVLSQPCWLAVQTLAISNSDQYKEFLMVGPAGIQLVKRETRIATKISCGSSIYICLDHG